MPSKERIEEAVVQSYCTPENENKVVDPVLIKTIVDKVYFIVKRDYVSRSEHEKKVAEIEEEHLAEQKDNEKEFDELYQKIAELEKRVADKDRERIKYRDKLINTRKEDWMNSRGYCWYCEQEIRCECMDATCWVCDRPFDKKRCKEFGFDDSGNLAEAQKGEKGGKP